MAIVIEPYRPEHEAAVQEFNGRMRTGSGDPDLVFSETAIPRWLPPANDNPVWNEFFVAVEGSAVRGAYALKHETMLVRGKGLQRVACYHHSLSEGIVDRAYTSVGVLLARHALARQPLLYALGMGGENSALARMLKVLGFTLTPIPFYFRVVNPARFLREMQALRQVRWRANLMDIAASTGTGWLALKLVQAMRSRPSTQFVIAEEVAEVAEWADTLWSEVHNTASLAAVRDAKTLRLLYPAKVRGTKRLRLIQNGATIGWAVVGIRRQDPKFGSMRVGSIVDCWASPDDAVSVVHSAVRTLEKEGVDLIVTNQGHQAWQSALEHFGFFKGPSTFIFAASRQFSELLKPIEETRPHFHLTRADGDGLPANF